MSKWYNHDKLTEARCPECESTQDLVVWLKDDDNSGCLHTLRCKACPPPTTCPFWMSKPYSPDWHDKALGLKDYTVMLSYSFHGHNVVEGLCFACRHRFDLSKGFGHEYVPRDLMQDREYNYAVAFCPSCYREHQRTHAKFETSPLLQLLLNAYWKDAQGQKI